MTKAARHAIASFAAALAVATAMTSAAPANAFADDAPSAPPVAGETETSPVEARTQGWLRASDTDPLRLDDLEDVHISAGEGFELMGVAHGGWGRLTYAWSMAPEGAGGASAWNALGGDDPQLSVLSADAGRYTVRLDVADRLGNRARASCTVVVDGAKLSSTGDGLAPAVAALAAATAAALFAVFTMLALPHRRATRRKGEKHV